MRNFVLLGLIFLLALILQMAVFSRLTLLQGSADLVLVLLAAFALQERFPFGFLWGAVLGSMVGLVSAAPWYIYLVGYFTVVAFSRFLARRIWQAPLLALFLVVLVGSVFLHALFILYLAVFGTGLLLQTLFIQVTLPSLFLNLLLSAVVYPLMRDLFDRLYPIQV